MKTWHVEQTNSATQTIEADFVEIRDQAFWFLKKVPEGRHGVNRELVAVIPCGTVMLVEEVK